MVLDAGARLGHPVGDGGFPAKIVLGLLMFREIVLGVVGFVEEEAIGIFFGAAAGEGVNWPSFRGPGASGLSEGFATPESWDAASGKNIKWKTTIAGLAHSSPIVWQDRVFVTTAVSENDKQGLKVGLYGDIAPVEENVEYEWKVICLDKKTGKILWEQTAHKGLPKVKRHPKGSHASSTPTTDGKHIIAFFGSEGLYCYDMEGKLI